MNPIDRINDITTALSQYEGDVNILAEHDPTEIARIAIDCEVKPKDMNRLIGAMIYLKHRLVHKKSRYEAFKAAFPERCICNGDNKTDISKYGSFETTVEPGELLSKATINMKAMRLEESPLYKKIYTFMQGSLFITYAVDRLKVLDEALDIALDPMTPLRDKDRYMKLFLDETRKPENAKGMEVNFNLQSNNISIATVEDKMNTIAQALNHATATEIIDVIQKGRDLNDSGEN